jgi:hypothetical protein
MKRTRTAYEYLGDVAKLVFKSNRNKQGSLEFDGANEELNLKVNNIAAATASETGVSVPGTLAVTGATTLTGQLNVNGGLAKQSTVVEKTASVTLTATQIVGTSAGDIGHAAGATLVAAPGAGYVLEFVSAVLIYDFDTAAYTGGGDDTVIQDGDGGVAMTTAIAGADLLEAAGDKIVHVTALSASDQALTANKPLTLQGTALTQPGTAAGVLRCHVTYKVHTTGL